MRLKGHGGHPGRARVLGEGLGLIPVWNGVAGAV